MTSTNLKMTIKTLQLRDIEIHDDLQLRVNENGTTKIDANLIAEYEDAIDKLPAVEVGMLDGIYYLTDGYHRSLAHRNLDRKEIKADVVEVECFLDLVKLAAKANGAHGLKRDKATLRRQIETLIRHGKDEYMKSRFELDSEKLIADTGAGDRWFRECTSELKGQLKAKRSEEILQLHNEGQSLRDIGAAVNMSGQAVKNILDSAVVKNRQECQKLTEASNDSSSYPSLFAEADQQTEQSQPHDLEAIMATHNAHEEALIAKREEEERIADDAEIQRAIEKAERQRKDTEELSSALAKINTPSQEQRSNALLAGLPTTATEDEYLQYVGKLDGDTKLQLKKRLKWLSDFLERS